MLDVQVMLKEAIDKCKDIEVCGDKERLVNFLKGCLCENRYLTKHWLYLCYLHRIDLSLQLMKDYWDNSTLLGDYCQNFSDIINDSSILYEVAKNEFNNVRELVVDHYAQKHNIDIRNTDVYKKINSIDYFINWNKGEVDYD
jgi:hypothetical protein